MNIALYQARTGLDPTRNADALVRAIGEAAAGDAAMLFTPEMSGLMDRDAERATASIFAHDDDPVLAAVRKTAAEKRVWVQLGSLAIRRADGRLANRSFVVDDAGAIRATYDKMHLFDVDLPTGERWRESARYAAGDAAMLANTPPGVAGLSICYDLRFPALYAALADAGATLFSIPAAFTVPTGRAHWHLLARARAVENGAWVVAAAQCGRHEDGRETFGHSLVVDPWGEIVLDMGAAEDAVGFATIDAAAAERARRDPGAEPPPPDPGAGVGAMIVFDLRCSGGHVFEAWFGKSADYDDQSARGLVACPLCGVADVGKAVMAPAIPGKSNHSDLSPADAKAMLGRLADAQARALASSDYVGERFADEARAIHLGEAEARSIHGQATRADAKALADDGVPVAPLPMPFVPPETKN